MTFDRPGGLLGSFPGMGDDQWLFQVRQHYEQRLKEGPEWLVWEKWMCQSRKQYEKEQ